MNERESPTPESDDRVVGRVFWWSVAIAAVASAAVALTLWLTPQTSLPEPLPEPPLSGPEKRGTTGAVPPGFRFTDVTSESGVDFVHRTGARGSKLLPETMGGGVAVFDVEPDGDPDLLFVSTNVSLESPEEPSGDALVLYRNDGSGHFEQVTGAFGDTGPLYGMGVATGDYDADGRIDVYVTAVGRNRLFHNDGKGFREVSEAAGIGGDPHGWSTGSAFFDADGDGDLDLMVADYVRWSPAIDREVDYQLTGIGRSYGPPHHYEGTFPRLYENLGDGRFRDVSEDAGIRIERPVTGAAEGKALALLPFDVDGDGLVDVFVANDTVRNFLFHNIGDGRFEEIGVEAGVAFGPSGEATGAMGVDAGWVDGEQRIAIAVGNFAGEMTSFFVREPSLGLFTDDAAIAGVGAPSRVRLTFGLGMLDLDLDGRLDLIQANGHLEPEIQRVQAGQQYAQPLQLLWNCAAGCRTPFVAVSPETTGDLGKPIVGRGLAWGDLDGDGDLDLVATQVGRSPIVLRNDTASRNHWLRVRLAGPPPNRDAIGATIELRSGGSVQRRWVSPTRSYLSQVDVAATFGLGGAGRVDELRVVWPDGCRQIAPLPAIDRAVTVPYECEESESDGRARE